MTLSQLFASNPWLLVSLVFVFGLVFGSFLNVVIYRLPIIMEREWTDQCREFLHPGETRPGTSDNENLSLSRPGSHCPKCKHEITAMENLPVLSYLIQGGKCTACKAPISPRYPIIEMVTALLSSLVAWRFGFHWLMPAVLLFTWGLIVLTMIDFDHQLLPDNITLPLLWLGLIINSFGLITSLQNALWGVVFGYLILWSIYWLFKLATGKEGMGYGDFKLLGALGAWMGWQALPEIILLSSLVGAIVGISLIAVMGRDRNIPIPFGPYLASAGFLSLIWGSQLSELYRQIFM